MRFRPTIAAVVIAAAGGCQPVPTPFAHQGTPDKELLVLADSGGIVVRAIAHAPPATSRALVAAMVEALSGAGVAASAQGGNRRSSWLEGRILDDGRDARIVWQLVDQADRAVGTVSQSIERTPVPAWAAGEPGLMARLVARTAPAIATLVQDEAVEQSIVPPIYVRAVAGASRAGNRQLREAMRVALRTQAMRVANAANDTTLRVAGVVEVTTLPDRPALRRVAIRWMVLDPFGVAVGEINQASAVEATQIAAQWDTTAHNAAMAGAAGIVEMLRQIDWRDGFMRADGRDGGDR